MIVIDDGNSDRTAEVVELAVAEVIRHPKNMGKGAAPKIGFAALNRMIAIVGPEPASKRNLL